MAAQFGVGFIFAAATSYAILDKVAERRYLVWLAKNKDDGSEETKRVYEARLRALMVEQVGPLSPEAEVASEYSRKFAKAVSSGVNDISVKAKDAVEKAKVTVQEFKSSDK